MIKKSKVFGRTRSIIMILLTVLMVVGLLYTGGISAKADPIKMAIPSVKVKIKAPIAGNKFSTSAVNSEYKKYSLVGTTEDYCEIVESYGIKYEKLDNSNNYIPMVEGDIFAENASYRVSVKLKTKTSNEVFTYDHTNYSCNGGSFDAESTKTQNTSISSDIIVYYSIKAQKGISKINVKVKSPVKGTKPTTDFDIVTEPEGVFVDNYKDVFGGEFKVISNMWEESIDGVSYTDMSSISVFTANKYYRLKGVFSTRLRMMMYLPNYCDNMIDYDKIAGLSDNFTVCINGEEKEPEEAYDFGQLIIKYVNKAECEVKVPIEGDKPSYSVKLVGEDKNKLEIIPLKSGDVTIADKIAWYEEGTGTYVNTFLND